MLSGWATLTWWLSRHTSRMLDREAERFCRRSIVGMIQTAPHLDNWTQPPRRILPASFLAPPLFDDHHQDALCFPIFIAGDEQSTIPPDTITELVASAKIGNREDFDFLAGTAGIPREQHEAL